MRSRLERFRGCVVVGLSVLVGSGGLLLAGCGSSAPATTVTNTMTVTSLVPTTITSRSVVTSMVPTTVVTTQTTAVTITQAAAEAAPAAIEPVPVAPVAEPETPAPAPAPAPVQPQGIADIPAPSAYYANCTAARAAGVTPLHRGDPGYASKLDRDDDGVACE